MGSDAAEFVDKVKDQVRNRQKRMSNVAESGEEHSIIWGMFMAATMNAATFMGKNFSTIQSVVKNHEDLTLKQMFDVTAQLVKDQEEIHGLDKIPWEKNSWKRLSLIGDEIVINLQRTKVCVFSNSVLCLGRVLQHPDSNEAWKNRIAGIRSEKSYRDYDAINGESTEFEWTSSQDSQRCSSVVKSMIYWATWDKHQKLSQEEFYLCQCSMTSLVTEKATKMNVWQMPESSKYLREDLVLDTGHLLDQVLKRSGILQRIVHKELGIISRTKCSWNSQKADILPSVQRLHCPGVSSRAKDMEKCRYTSLQMNSQLTQFFALPFSVNQLSIYGAVAAVCEEFESHQDGSGQPEILMGKSIVLGEIKAEVPLQNENPFNHQILWQQYIERIESLSPDSKVSRFCKEAGFMRVVEVGQYLVTKDTGNLRQFRSVACRDGFVYHDTSGQNHGPVWKTQLFLLNAICMVILGQDYYGNGNLRKFYWKTVGRRLPIGNACSYIVKKDYSYLCMWMTSNWLERNKTLIRCGKYPIKKLIWENQHLSLIYSMHWWPSFQRRRNEICWTIVTCMLSNCSEM